MDWNSPQHPSRRPGWGQGDGFTPQPPPTGGPRWARKRVVLPAAGALFVLGVGIGATGEQPQEVRTVAAKTKPGPTVTVTETATVTVTATPEPAPTVTKVKKVRSRSPPLPRSRSPRRSPSPGTTPPAAVGARAARRRTTRTAMRCVPPVPHPSGPASPGTGGIWTVTAMEWAANRGSRTSAYVILVALTRATAPEPKPGLRPPVPAAGAVTERVGKRTRPCRRPVTRRRRAATGFRAPGHGDA